MDLKAFYSPIWNLADKTKRTPLAGLDARIFVKLALLSTTQLVSRMQRAGKDTNLDDETHELTARLQSIGYDWKWNESTIEPVDLLSNSNEIIRSLKAFVSQCASDDLDRISPGLKREAVALLAKLSPGPGATCEIGVTDLGKVSVLLTNQELEDIFVALESYNWSKERQQRCRAIILRIRPAQTLTNQTIPL